MIQQTAHRARSIALLGFVAAALVAIAPDQPPVIGFTMRALGTILIVGGVAVWAKVLVARANERVIGASSNRCQPSAADWDGFMLEAGAPGPPATLSDVGACSVCGESLGTRAPRQTAPVVEA